MKILVSHLFFWPDTAPYASLLRAIGEHFSDQDHDVSVFSSQPSYKPELENVTCGKKDKVGELQVYRALSFFGPSRKLFCRAVNSFLFVSALACHILFQKKRYDVVMCSTMPPVVTGWVTGWMCRIVGSRFVYHCMDMYPEISEKMSHRSPHLLIALGRYLEKGTCRRANPLIVLSEDMAKSYQNRDPDVRLRTRIINNFALPGFQETGLSEPDPGFVKRPGKFRVLYAGNLGRYQKLDSILAIASMVADDERIEFVFMGEGRIKISLREKVKQAGLRNVIFIPFQNDLAYRMIHQDSDVGVISLDKDLYRMSYPSKTGSMLLLGCPLLVLAESDSELCQMVREHSVGFSCEHDNLDAAAQWLKDMAGDDSGVDLMEKRSRKLGESRFSVEALLAKWSGLLDEWSKELK